MTFIPVYAKVLSVTSLIQTGSGILSACADRYQPESDFLSVQLPPQLLDAPAYWEAIARILPEAKVLAIERAKGHAPA